MFIVDISSSSLFSIYIRPLLCQGFFLFRVKYTNTLLYLYSLKGITCFAIVHMSYTYCARQFACAVINEVRRIPFLYFLFLYFSISPNNSLVSRVSLFPDALFGARLLSLYCPRSYPRVSSSIEKKLTEDREYDSAHT